MSGSSHIARRLFWQQLATSVLSSATPVDHVCLDLEDLPRVPPDELFPLIPRIVDGIQFQVQDWQLVAIREGTTDPFTLGAWLPVEAWLLNRFDGTRTLERIALEAAGQYGWSETVARHFVREFFIRLALLEIVVPVNHVSQTRSHSQVARA